MRGANIHGGSDEIESFFPSRRSPRRPNFYEPAVSARHFKPEEPVKKADEKEKPKAEEKEEASQAVVTVRKKVVVKLLLDDDKCKKKAMKVVSGVSGVDSLAVDMNGMKLTVIGNVDPMDLMRKLRKLFFAELVAVGPVMEKV